jgi:hypothetical protein
VIIELRLKSVSSISLFHLSLLLGKHVLGIIVKPSEAVALKEGAFLANQIISVFIDGWSKGIYLSVDRFSYLRRASGFGSGDRKGFAFWQIFCDGLRIGINDGFKSVLLLLLLLDRLN